MPKRNEAIKVFHAWITVHFEKQQACYVARQKQ